MNSGELIKESNQIALLTANTSWYLYNFRKNLIRALIYKGYKVIVACPKDEYSSRLENLGCTHHAWHVGRKSITPYTEIRSIRSLRKIILESSPTIMHNHTLKAVLYGSLAARGSGIPIINSIAGRGFLYSSRSFSAKILKPLVNLLLKFSLKSKKLITIFENQVDREYFINKGLANESKTVLLPSVGVDLERFVPVKLPETDEFIIGYVGRLLWSKGVGTFVEAARILNAKNTRIKFVLIGLPDPGNPESIPLAELQAWQENGIIENWGWQEDMPTIYANIHVLVLPTIYAEGVPTVLLEAGACERALIASDTPGCREVIVDGINGYLIPHDDHMILAERILYLERNPEEYNSLRLQARLSIAKDFNQKKINKMTTDIYQSLQNG